MLAGQDLVVVLLIALLLLGPKQLPLPARGLGQSVREFKKGAEGLLDEDKPVAPEPPKPAATEQDKAKP
jgi:sec-independent protein translocase protein TatA